MSHPQSRQTPPRAKSTTLVSLSLVNGLGYQTRLQSLRSILRAMAGVLDAAKRRIRTGNQRGVDADHAALDRVSEQQRPPSVLREAIRCQPVGQPIGLFDRIVKRLEWTHQRNRSERLLIHDACLERYIGQYRGSEEKAIVAGAAAAFSTGGDTRTDFQRIGDEACDCFGTPRIGHGSHLIEGIETVADRDFGGPCGELLDESLVDAFLHVETRRGGADL